jgi:hypothetical protein
MRTILLVMAACAGGWFAIHESLQCLTRGPGLQQPSLMLGLVAVPAGLVGALAALLLLSLLLPPARG